MSEVYIKEPTTNGKVIFRTSHGDLEIELWATETPKACRNFCQLILEGYYNGTAFHRVIKDFIVQGGDRSGTGDGSESIYGSPYPDEIHPRLKFRYRGMMGVASAGKGTKTNGSQFFIVLDRTSSLDGKHTLFAKVVGQTIYNLQRIAEVQVNKKDRPLEPPRVIRAELVWDPFGDLEPRRMPSPPRPISAGPGKKGEEHRRAPVHNKRILSFGGGSDGEEEKEAGDAVAAPSGKSAHDLLSDPKLSKDAAYPQEQRNMPPPRALTGQVAGTAASTASASSAASGGGAEGSRPVARHAPREAKVTQCSDESGYGDSGEDGSSEGAEVDDDVAQGRSQKRQETILQLKRDIVSVSVTGAAPADKRRRPQSALEELRSGYAPRALRQRAKGKEGKREEAALIMSKMNSFKDRLRTAVADGPGGGAGAADEAGGQERKGEGEAEEGTFAAIWQEGEEEMGTDWLLGDGLKFHVSADKAFKLQSDKARETLDIFDPLAARGNAEVLADARKKASEKMVPQKRKESQKAREEQPRERRGGKGA